MRWVEHTEKCVLFKEILTERTLGQSGTIATKNMRKK